MFHFQRTRDRDGDPSKRSYSILRHVEPDEQKQTVGWFSMKGINHDRTIVAIECLLTTTEPERAESSRTEIECRDRYSLSRVKNDTAFRFRTLK